MPITLTFDGRTVMIYSLGEAKATMADAGVAIFSVTHWAEPALLNAEALRTALTSMVNQANNDGVRRAHCVSGEHRSTVAAILYLWSQAENKTLGAVVDAAEAAFEAAKSRLHPKIPESLELTFDVLLSMPRSRKKWEDVRSLTYAPVVKPLLFGA